jgi:hypothetical protein
MTYNQSATGKTLVGQTLVKLLHKNEAQSSKQLSSALLHGSERLKEFTRVTFSPGRRRPGEKVDDAEGITAVDDAERITAMMCNRHNGEY